MFCKMNMNKKFNEEAIDTHNKLRALHGCSPLTLDKVLASSSQTYAEVLARRNCLEHSNNNNYGENLAYKSGFGASEFNGAEVSIMWYSEIKDYDFRIPDTTKCGHFSQVIWKNTSSAGFGIAMTPDGRSVYVVGRYNPPGNFRGQWAENVPRPLNERSTIPTLEELAAKPKQTQTESQMNLQEDVVSKFDQSLLEYRTTMLQIQNDVRQKYGVRLMQENKELAGIAQNLAEKIKNDHKFIPDNIQYGGRKVGVIIFCSRLRSHHPKSIVKLWCKERARCQNECNVASLRKAKNFTQLIWDASSEVGVGAVLSRYPRKSVVVCLYTPAGNVADGYAKNITPYWNRN